MLLLVLLSSSGLAIPNWTKFEHNKMCSMLALKRNIRDMNRYKAKHQLFRSAFFPCSQWVTIGVLATLSLKGAISQWDSKQQPNTHCTNRGETFWFSRAWISGACANISANKHCIWYRLASLFAITQPNRFQFKRIVLECNAKHAIFSIVWMFFCSQRIK